MNHIKGMIYESLFFNRGTTNGRSNVVDENSTATGIKGKTAVTTGSVQAQPIASKAYNATQQPQQQRGVLKDLTNKAPTQSVVAKKAVVVATKPATVTTNTATKRSAAILGTSRPVSQQQQPATRSSVAASTTSRPASISTGAAGGGLLRTSGASSGVSLRGEKENVNPNSLAAPRAVSIPIPSAKATKTTTIASRPPARSTNQVTTRQAPSLAAASTVINAKNVNNAPKDVTLKFSDFEVSSSEDEDGFESAEDDPAIHFNSNKRNNMEDSSDSLGDSDTSDLILAESNMKSADNSTYDFLQRDDEEDGEEDEDGEAMDVDDEIINHHQVHKLVNNNHNFVDLEEDESEVYDDRLGAGVEDIDCGDLSDPRFLAEYINEIYDVLRKLESDAKIDAEYMSRQKFLLPWMRGVLVDWLTEVSMKCMLRSDTLFLAVQILDRFLQVRVVPRSRLQLIGATALLVASKFEETFSLPTDDLVILSDKDFSKEDLIKMERVMLHDLKWNLTVPTSLLFLRRYGKAAQSDLKIHTLCKFIIELSLAEYSLLRFLPSIQAAASIYLARRMTGITPVWSSTLAHYSGFVEADLIGCAKQLNNLLRAETSKTENAKAVVLKYKAENFFRVARIPPLRDL